MLEAADYEKEETLGAGAFGTVYRVRSKINGKKYAMKVQQLNSYDAAQIVENEVEVLRKMRPHPNVIAYYGSWKEFGMAYILMEYAETGSLDDIMRKRGKPFSEKTSLFIFAQLMLGVNHIHRHSIIHRDLKPANVMVDRVRNDNGEYLQIVKIGDFGIAKDTGVSVARTAIGTRLYMAPETLTGSRYDSRCDMWSGGIILYELLTNEYPFEADNPMAMIAKIKRGQVASIPLQNIPQWVKNMIYGLLSVNPAERLRSRDVISHPAIIRHNEKVIEHHDNGESSRGRSTIRLGDTYGAMCAEAARQSELQSRRPIVIRKMRFRRSSSEDSDSD